MAALSAKRQTAACSVLYERLIDRGGTKKQALIAVAHKLIRQAWGVLHHQRPYLDGFVQPLTL